MNKDIKQYQEDIEAGVEMTTNGEEISNSLAVAEGEPSMGYSKWIAHGKKFGYHDYWKDMTRIAIIEAIEKKYPNYVEDYHDEVEEIINLIKEI